MSCPMVKSGVNLMNIRTLAAALAGAVLFGLTAAPAFAQSAASGAAPSTADVQATPAKPKPNAKTSPGATTVVVTVTNSRKADLIQLQAAEPGSANWTKVLDLHGTFADGQSMEASGIDVCADKTLNLTD